MATIGTLMRKTEPHQNCDSMRPPTTGPMAPPAEKLASQTPIAKVRCLSSRNMLRIKERVEGASVAAATPSTARARIKVSAFQANAAKIEARPKAIEPIIRMRRRPMRSPSVPIVIREPATMKP
ncbi:hypothetical protein D9M70_487290 [compost metagenome]